MIDNLKDHVLKIRRNVIWLYLLTLCVMLIGSGIALSRNWIDQLRSAETSLLHHASMVSAIVDASLVDALKLLEFTQRDLQAFNIEQMPPEKIHEVLHASMDKFGFNHQDEVFGRLFFMDRAGNIVAQNAEGVLPLLNISDRRYFRELQKEPVPRFSIGDMVTARVTGTSVFHMAVPILNRQGQFVGLLAQQIKIQDLSRIIELSHSQNSDHFYSFLSDGRIAFMYPSQLHPERSNFNEMSEDLYSQTIKNVSPRGNFTLGRSINSSIVGYMTSPDFGLITVATLPTVYLLHQFIADQMYLLLYIVVAGGLVTVFFYLFYKKSVAYQQMQNRSVHDNLTGLYNRRGLDEVLPELIRQSQRQQEPISVLFIDIDHFKWFNDHCGHEAGDQVLSNLARLLQRHLKRPLDFACRWGGEEFVIVLPNTDEAGAVHLAETILAAVRRMSTAKESLAKSQITVSIGISSMIVTPENIQDDLIDQADKAMFSAKNNGRDQLVVYRTLI